MSERPSTRALRHGPARDSCRRACPRIPPPLPKSSSLRARPKSATHGLPDASIRMLAGLMSRWTSPGCGRSARLRRSWRPIPLTPESRRPMLPDPDRQVASFDELGDDEAQTVVGATHVMNRHDMGMVEVGDDAGFGQVCLDILGPRDSFGAGNLDRNGAVELLVIGQEDLTEAALAQAPEDVVPPDLRRMKQREGARTSTQRPVASRHFPRQAR